MEFRPRVSIVIPVCNGSDFLREAVDSALGQTYGNAEVIVVDDGSDDDGRTEAIARSYGDRIRHIRKENGGVASALNAGVRAMTGEYFSWLSHDDVYLPRKIEVQVEALRKGRKDVVLYGDYELIDRDSNVMGVTRVGRMKAREFRMLLITDIPVNGCTTLVPKACFDAVGLFDEKLRVAQDYDLWFRIAGRFEFLHVPGIGLRSRLHPGQGTRTMEAVCLEEGNGNFIRFLDEMARGRAFPLPARLAWFFYGAAVRLKRRGYRDASRHALDLYFAHSAGRPLFSAFNALIARGYYGIADRRWVTRIAGLFGFLGRAAGAR